MRRALITGITGQDGSHLAELLLGLGYRVTGFARGPARYLNPDAAGQIDWVHGDVRDDLAIEVAIHKAQPDEIYNLAGQTFVPPSWTCPEETFDVNVGSLTRILNVVERICPKARVYQASSSEMYGNTVGALDENSKMAPRSPYGASKLAAHHIGRIYREKGLFVCCGILFNHEGPRRGMEYVTRKISYAVAHWALGRQFELKLGNMDAQRDWGYAGDYVRAMHMMMQQEQPDDYVIGRGLAYSIRDFLTMALTSVKMKWDDVRYQIKVDQSLVRPNEIGKLVANTKKAKKVLGWEPQVSCAELASMMVAFDMMRLEGTGSNATTTSDTAAVR